MKKTVLYIAGALCLIWGIAHLFPTANIVKDFGDISNDNKLILTMEWINEGATLIFLGILTIAITMTDPFHKISILVYRLIILMLFTLSIISLFTGFGVDFLPFKLCPVIFTTSAILIAIGMMMKGKISK